MKFTEEEFLEAYTNNFETLGQEIALKCMQSYSLYKEDGSVCDIVRKHFH